MFYSNLAIKKGEIRNIFLVFLCLSPPIAATDRAPRTTGIHSVCGSCLLYGREAGSRGERKPLRADSVENSPSRRAEIELMAMTMAASRVPPESRKPLCHFPS